MLLESTLTYNPNPLLICAFYILLVCNEYKYKSTYIFVYIHTHMNVYLPCNSFNVQAISS